MTVVPNAGARAAAMMSMPVLETERLRIRPFTLDDLEAIHQLLDVDLRHVDFGDTVVTARNSCEAVPMWPTEMAHGVVSI